MQDKIVLRYEAVLEPAGEGVGARLIALDRERRFIVSFFLADQTLAVFEPPQPNRCSAWQGRGQRLLGDGVVETMALSWRGVQTVQAARVDGTGCTCSCTHNFPCACHLAPSKYSPFPFLPCSGMTGGKFLERGKVYKPGNKLVGPGQHGAWKGKCCCVPSAL